MDERPDLLIILFAIVMIGSVATWVNQGGFNHLLEEGKTGSLFSVAKPVNFDNVIKAQNTDGRSVNDGSSFASRPEDRGGQIVLGDKVYDKSIYYGQVKIDRGTAGSGIQANDEYVVLNADSNLKAPINITGWSLRNGRDLKLQKVSGDLIRFKAITATIGRGVKTFNKKGAGYLEDIYLKSGERAVVVTGNFPWIDETPIKNNFKTNLCTGYLENLEYYNFKPSLSPDCPLVSDEISTLDYLEEDCYRYLKGLPRCFTPKFEAVYRVGNDEYRDVVKGGPLTLSSQCKVILRDNFNYQACLDKHSGDANFEGKEWRVFLYHLGAMYDRNREVITLLDGSGRIVDQVAY